jgi:pimeloyl-ACP methyl ester carboxylesterase
MGEGKVKTNGIEIWYEDFGNPDNPAVLMIMGAGTQATFWPLELIDPIVKEGYHVVRFDNRDVGLSTWISDYESSPYTLEDMARDSIGLMDVLRIKQAHIIGASMGGMIAQLAAIKYPQRVLSLISWMSTYAFDDPDIPAMTEEVRVLVNHMMTSPPQTRDDVIEFHVVLAKTLAGSRFQFDEKAARAFSEASFERGHNPRNNHGPATLASSSRLDALRKLNVPTLVIHGDEDPIINYIHGVVCAKVIPGAKLHTQKGVGHEIPLGILPETIPIILKHLGGMYEISLHRG